jgi:hypothetical protein
MKTLPQGERLERMCKDLGIDTTMPAQADWPGSYDTRIPCDEPELQRRLMEFHWNAREAKLARIAAGSVVAAVISTLAAAVSLAAALMK